MESLRSAIISTANDPIQTLLIGSSIAGRGSRRRDGEGDSVGEVGRWGSVSETLGEVNQNIVEMSPRNGGDGLRQRQQQTII